MNGPSASTAAARISNTPITHKNTAGGVSQRLSPSLRHSPPARSAIDPPALPNTISPRRILPRFLIMRPPLLLDWAAVSAPERVQLRAHRYRSEGTSNNLPPRD